MITKTTSDLPRPTPRDLAIDDLARTVAAHDAHVADIAAMSLIETGGAALSDLLSLPLTVGAWNLERCLFPEASAHQMADCDLLLLSEMDSGMARTRQRNTTRDMAQVLGMNYTYGIEFLELGLGSPIEHSFCTDTANAQGFHGNGLMARGTVGAPFVIRLHGHRQWFLDVEQPRLGERMAIGARIATDQGDLIAVSTHLESASGPAHREEQMRGLIAGLDAQFPGLPILIGGDLNTGNDPGGDWRAEGLFDVARAAGFTVHGGPEEQTTTRPSLITRWPDRAMKLDWFLARDLTLGPVEIRPSLDPDGRPLSDHDAVVAQILSLGAP